MARLIEQNRDSTSPFTHEIRFFFHYWLAKSEIFYNDHRNLRFYQRTIDKISLCISTTDWPNHRFFGAIDWWVNVTKNYDFYQQTIDHFAIVSTFGWKKSMSFFRNCLKKFAIFCRDWQKEFVFFYRDWLTKSCTFLYRQIAEIRFHQQTID